MPNENNGRKGGPNTQANFGRSAGTSGTMYGRRKRSEIAWGSLDTNEVGRWVARVCDSGYGLVLGRTNDGGALSVTILDGDQRIREYPSSVEDFADFVQWCENALGSAGGTPANAPGGK